MSRPPPPLRLGRDVHDPTSGVHIEQLVIPPPDLRGAPPGVTLGDVIDAVARRPLLVLAATVLGGLLGVLGASRMEDSYAATAQLTLDPQLVAITAPEGGAPNPLTEQSEAATVIQTMTSPLVVERAPAALPPAVREGIAAEARVDEAMGAGAAEASESSGVALREAMIRRALSEDLEVAGDGRSYVVEVTYRSEDPARAAAVANAVADAYLDARRDTREEAFGVLLSGLDAEIARLQADLGAAERTAARLREERRVLGLRMEALTGRAREGAVAENADLYAREREAERQADALAAVFERLLVDQRELQARMGLPELGVRLMSAARVPVEPAGPDLAPVMVALGAGAGLLAGASLAVARRPRRPA